MAFKVLSRFTAGSGDVVCKNVSAAIWLIDDFTKKIPLGPIKVTIQKKYLFNWLDLQENDTVRLKDFFIKGFGFDWVHRAIIEKDNDDTIKVYEDEKNILWLRLNEEEINKEEIAVDLYTRDRRIGEFVAIKENGNLNIYYKRAIKPVKNLGGYYIFIDLFPGIYIVDIESDYYVSEELTVYIPGFESAGPAKDAINVALTDVSELHDGDEVEFRNPSGDVERRFITIDSINREIAWDNKLKYDFSKAGSTVLDCKYLGAEITLKPGPLYPFPGHATLVKGLVSNNGPVPNAIVKDTVNSKLTKTNKNGEFVLFYKGIEDGTSIEIDIIKNGKSEHVKDITVTLEKTLSLGKILLS